MAAGHYCGYQLEHPLGQTSVRRFSVEPEALLHGKRDSGFQNVPLRSCPSCPRDKEIDRPQMPVYLAELVPTACT